MANPNIGEIDCEACEKRGAANVRAFVRQDKNGKLYVLCPRCGKVTRGNPAGQDYLLTYARLYAHDRREQEAARAAAAVDAKKAAPVLIEAPAAPVPADPPAPPPMDVKKITSTNRATPRGFFEDLDL